jgi:hypothetical protein
MSGIIGNLYYLHDEAKDKKLHSRTIRLGLE